MATGDLSPVELNFKFPRETLKKVEALAHLCVEQVSGSDADGLGFMFK